MPLIECKNLALAYDGMPVIASVTFSVNAGDCVCIVGENGSGKSSLIKCILGLLPKAEGQIIFGDGLMENQIGYLPQQTIVMRHFPASVYEVVISGLLNSKPGKLFYSKEDKSAAENALSVMGISEIAKKSYLELSGGQQQRVLLARAMLSTKRLMLLDEPTAGLDPIVTRELYDRIKVLNKEKGITILMVSHDIREAIAFSTHILHLGKEQLFFGSTNDYVESDVGKKFMCIWGCEHHVHS